MTHLTSEKNKQYFNKPDKKIVSLVLYSPPKPLTPQTL